LSGSRFRVTEEKPISIGRAAEVDICVSDVNVSKHHCSISFEPPHCILTSSSRNGTLVNDQQINNGESVKLGIDDEIIISEGTRLKIVQADSDYEKYEEDTVDDSFFDGI